MLIIFSAEGVSHNLVIIYRLMGKFQEEAFENINNHLKACFRNWYLAHAEPPQWGEAVDSGVFKYIRGIQDLVLANLNPCITA